MPRVFTMVALLSTLNAYGQSIKNPDGSWEGVMERQGATMTVRFEFRTADGAVTGRFTSETQSAMEYPLDQVVYSPPLLHWKLGDTLSFEGVVSQSAITGTFLDGKEKGTFSLKPVQPV